MDYNAKLLSKNGQATLAIAKEFLKYNIGDKTATVQEVSTQLGFSIGTVQNSIQLLQKNEAIKLESKGHLGTYLIKKNVSILLSFANVNTIVGVMPLPYSKRYEGLATGLIVSMENQYNIPATMAFMRGAKNRIGMLLANRYDYAVTSSFAAKQYLEENNDIVIVKNFGKNSFLSEHVVIFKDKEATSIEDGMRVGIDVDSIDQKQLTEKICEGKNVEFINIGYSQILQKVLYEDIDAAIWNKDEITEKFVDINYIPVQSENVEDTEAVIVVNAERKEMVVLLEEIIDVNTVLSIQKLIIEDKIRPSY